MRYASLPVRECGLKFCKYGTKGQHIRVTPRAGVWIEITAFILLVIAQTVTPRAGVWIEISYQSQGHI